MPLAEKLEDFAGAIGLAATRAPDDYGTSQWNYVENMTDIRELWAEISALIARDREQVDFISQKLEQMFSSFDAGDKDGGRSAAWAIYNIRVRRLR